jgi:predicted nucleic acid-binding Zn finger protein
MGEAIAALATLLTKVFGFVVDPAGLGAMKTEHRLEVIHAGIKVAISKKDYDAIDVLFDNYRELSKSIN